MIDPAQGAHGPVPGNHGRGAHRWTALVGLAPKCSPAIARARPCRMTTCRRARLVPSEAMEGQTIVMHAEGQPYVTDTNRLAEASLGKLVVKDLVRLRPSSLPAGIEGVLGMGFLKNYAFLDMSAAKLWLMPVQGVKPARMEKSPARPAGRRGWRRGAGPDFAARRMKSLLCHFFLILWVDGWGRHP
jgi:hypothetical protein